MHVGAEGFITLALAVEDAVNDPLARGAVHAFGPSPALAQPGLQLGLPPPRAAPRAPGRPAIGPPATVPPHEPAAAQVQPGHPPAAAWATEPRPRATVVAGGFDDPHVVVDRLAVVRVVQPRMAGTRVNANRAHFLACVAVGPPPGVEAAGQHVAPRQFAHVEPQTMLGLDVPCRPPCPVARSAPSHQTVGPRRSIGFAVSSQISSPTAADKASSRTSCQSSASFCPIAAP